MHVATTRRVYKGKTYVTHLLRRTIRKGKIVTHQNLGNLSHLLYHLIEIIKRSVKGETSSRCDAFRITRPLRTAMSTPSDHDPQAGPEDLIASEAVAATLRWSSPCSPNASSSQLELGQQCAMAPYTTSGRGAGDRPRHRGSALRRHGGLAVDEQQEAIEKKLAGGTLYYGALVRDDSTPNSDHQGNNRRWQLSATTATTGRPIIVHGLR